MLLQVDLFLCHLAVPPLAHPKLISITRYTAENFSVPCNIQIGSVTTSTIGFSARWIVYERSLEGGFLLVAEYNSTTDRYSDPRKYYGVTYEFVRGSIDLSISNFSTEDYHALEFKCEVMTYVHAKHSILVAATVNITRIDGRCIHT